MKRPGAWRTTPGRIDKSYGLFGSDSEDEDEDSSGVLSRGDHKIPSLAAPIPIRPSLDTYPALSDPSDVSKSKSQGLWAVEPSSYKSPRLSAQHPSSSQQDPWGRNQVSWGNGGDVSWGTVGDVSWGRGQDSWSGDEDSWGRDEDSWGRDQDRWGRGAETAGSEVGGGLSGLSKSMSQPPWAAGQPTDPRVEHSSNRPSPNPSESKPIPVVQGRYDYSHDREGSSRGDRTSSKEDKYSQKPPKGIFSPYLSPRRHPALQDESQLDETATPNSFSTSSPLLDPKPLAIVTAEPVNLTKLHPRSIPVTQNGTATPTEFSKSSAQRTVDPKPAVEATDELLILNKPHPKLILAMQEDSRLDQMATRNAFSNSSSDQASDPKRLMEATAEPVTLTEPHPSLTPATQDVLNAFSSLPGAVDFERVVEDTDDLVTLARPHPKLILFTPEDSQLDETAAPNAFSTSFPLLGPKRLVETTVEAVAPTEPHPTLTPATQDETETPNPFSSLRGAVDSERVVEVAAEPVTLTKPHPKLILTTQEDSQLDEIVIPNGFTTSSSLLDPKRLVETTAEPVTLTEPYPTLTAATQDEMETPNPFSSPYEAAESGEQVVGVATEPATRIGPVHPTPKSILPTPKLDAELHEMAVPNIRLMKTSTLLLGLVIVTITLATLHQNWTRTSHL